MRITSALRPVRRVTTWMGCTAAVGLESSGFGMKEWVRGRLAAKQTGGVRPPRTCDRGPCPSQSDRAAPARAPRRAPRHCPERIRRALATCGMPPDSRMPAGRCEETAARAQYCQDNVLDKALTWTT